MMLAERLKGRLITTARRPWLRLTTSRKNEPVRKPAPSDAVTDLLRDKLAMLAPRDPGPIAAECEQVLDRTEKVPGKAYGRLSLTRDIEPGSPLFDLAFADDVVSALYGYFGTMPILYGLRILESTESGAYDPDISFHYDRYDDVSVRLFVYLNDVGPEQAPFRYIPYAVCKKLLRPKISRVDADYVERRRLPIRELTGPAGTAFLCDVRHLLHSGKVLTSGKRTAFSAIYTYRNALTRHSLSDAQIAALKGRWPEDSPQHALIPDAL